MQIVITDGYTLNPGDLSWQSFAELGDVVPYDRTSPELVAERVRSASVIVTNKVPVTAETMDVARQLKLIAVTATGYNIVDIEAATKRRIPVCNVPGYGTDSVAQHTFALLFELTNHVGINSQSVKNGEWSSSMDWCYTKKSILEISGKTLGIVGYGRIGQKVAEIARAFGMKVLYHDKYAMASEQNVSLEDLFSSSDFVSLHCPLEKENHSFVNRTLLSLMKPGAYLINTARGQLINEVELADALMEKRLAGAALDVLASEPPHKDHPLTKIPNCIVTPHNAWVSFEARQRILITTLNNIKSALAGTPTNVVNII